MKNIRIVKTVSFKCCVNIALELILEVGILSKHIKISIPKNQLKLRPVCIHLFLILFPQLVILIRLLKSHDRMGLMTVPDCCGLTSPRQFRDFKLQRFKKYLNTDLKNLIKEQTDPGALELKLQTRHRGITPQDKVKILQ